MLYLQKRQNLQNLQQVSCFFLDIPKDTAMYMYMYGYAELLWFKIWHHPPPPPCTRVGVWICVYVRELTRRYTSLSCYWRFYSLTHSLTHSPTHLESVSKFQKALFRYSRTCIYNGPVLSGQFSKSLFFTHTNDVFVTCIRWPPLLSGRCHPVAVLAYVCLSLLFLPVLSGHPWTETNMIQYQ